MTRPLRAAHLATFVALSALLPAVFIAALAVRRPIPVTASTPLPLEGKTFDVAGKDYRFRFIVAGSQLHFVPGTYALHPDVLVYATATPSSFPSTAQLIGPVRIGDPLQIGAADSLVFFSLGHRAVLTSVALGGTR